MGRRHVRPVKQAVPRRGVLIHAIAVLAHEAWRDGRTSTPMGFEGAFWHALRGGLILRYGLSWAAANAEAGAIVGEGLRQAGGKRPSWREGQPEWTDGANVRNRDVCANCEKPLEPDQRVYCSKTCYAAHKARMDYRDRAMTAEAVYALRH